MFESEQFDAVAEDVEGPALVELVAEAVEEGFGGVGAVVIGQGFPGIFVGGLHPRQHIS